MTLNQPTAKRPLEDEVERAGKKAKTHELAGVATPIARRGSPAQLPSNAVRETNANANYERGSSAATENHGNMAMIGDDEGATEEGEMRVEDREEGLQEDDRKVEVKIRGVGLSVDVWVGEVEGVKVGIKVGRKRAHREGAGAGVKVEEVKAELDA